MVAISSNGRHALTESLFEELVWWDIANDRCERVLKVPSGSMTTSLAISSDGLIALSGSRDGAVRCWDLVNGFCLHNLYGHLDKVLWVALSRSNHYGLSISESALKMWDLESGMCVETVEHELNNFVFDDSFAFDVSCRMTGSQGDIRRQLLKILANVFECFYRSSVSLRLLAISPDGRYALLNLVGQPPSLVLFDLLHGHSMTTYQFDSTVHSAAFSPADTNQVIVGLRNGEVQFFRIEEMP
jgi:WD40 repeat protein